MNSLTALMISAALCGGSIDTQFPSHPMMEYREFLQSLDDSDFHSISKAFGQYETQLGKEAIEIRDGGLVLFREFFQRVANKAMPRVVKELGAPDADALIARLESPPLRDELLQNGLGVFAELGECYLDQTPEYLVNAFSKYVSPEVGEFLKLRETELSEGFQSDAALLISHESVGKRAVAWERYLAKYPKSILKPDAEYFYDTYLSIFLIGLDNSPVFDFDAVPGGGEQYVMPDETRREFQDFIKAFPDTRSANVVAEFNALAEKSGFRLTPDIKPFVKSQGLRWPLAWAPHRR